LAATIPAGVQLHPKQEMVRNNGSEPDTLDPARAEGVPANNVIRDLFEGLTAVDGAGNMVPGVAESWKQVDAKTWVFKLRQNAKWSNGDPVTAEDFMYGMRRFVDPKTASEYAATFGIFFVNGKEIVEGKKTADRTGRESHRQIHGGAQDPVPGRLYALAGVQPATRPHPQGQR
jgi:oligopeptide transport system substrate-binding protein